MKEIFVLCFMCFFTQDSLSAQDWDLNMGIDYLVQQNFIDTISWQFSSLSFIDDSLAVQRITQASGERISHYKPLLNYHFGIMYNFENTNRIKFSIGPKFRYNLYSQTSSTDGIGSEIFSIDTISQASVMAIDPFCDQFSNNASDVPEPADDIKISILDFALASDISYELIKDRLGIGILGMLTTPVYTERLRELFDLNVEEVDGLTICSFDGLIQERNRTGDDFRNLKLEIGFFTNYKIDEYVGLRIGINRAFSNTFVSHVSVFESSALNREDKLFPISISMSFSYRIKS